MPQASDELRAAWPGMDTEALEHLAARGWYMQPFGVYRRPKHAHVISLREYSALEYLCDEWDYAFDLNGSTDDGLVQLARSDYELLIEFRTLLPALCAALERSEKRIAELEEQLEGFIGADDEGYRT